MINSTLDKIHSVLTPNFIEILKITIKLCAKEPQIIDPANSYRIDKLEPQNCAFELFKSTNSNHDYLVSLRDLVFESIDAKLKLFSKMSLDDLTNRKLSGKFLLLSPLAVMYDDLALNYSRGFFDSSNLPPYNCWLDFPLFGEPNDYETGYLISWIPSEAEEVVVEGINACPGKSLFFSTDLEKANEYHGKEAVIVCEELNKYLVKLEEGEFNL